MRRSGIFPSSLRVISVDASGTTAAAGPADRSCSEAAAAFGECVMRANESGKEGMKEGSKKERGFALSFRRGGF